MNVSVCRSLLGTCSTACTGWLVATARLRHLLGTASEQPLLSGQIGT